GHRGRNRRTLPSGARRRTTHRNARGARVRRRTARRRQPESGALARRRRTQPTVERPPTPAIRVCRSRDRRAGVGVTPQRGAIDTVRPRYACRRELATWSRWVTDATGCTAGVIPPAGTVVDYIRGDTDDARGPRAVAVDVVAPPRPTRRETCA